MSAVTDRHEGHAAQFYWSLQGASARDLAHPSISDVTEQQHYNEKTAKSQSCYLLNVLKLTPISITTDAF